MDLFDEDFDFGWEEMAVAFGLGEEIAEEELQRKKLQDDLLLSQDDIIGGDDDC